jgi:hypothetical protein
LLLPLFFAVFLCVLSGERLSSAISAAVLRALCVLRFPVADRPSCRAWSQGGGLLVGHDHFAVLNLDPADIVRQLQAVALFQQAFLQLIVHQRHRHFQIADLDLGRLERGKAVF